MPNELFITAVWADWLIEVLEENRKDVGSILKDLSIRRADLKKPGSRIAFAKFTALVKRAVNELDDPFLGLHLGSQIDIRRGGLIAYIMLNTPTLGQAVLNYKRYGRVNSDVVDIVVERNDKWWRAAKHFLDPEVLGERSVIDAYLAADLQIARILTGVKLIPQLVQISYPKLDDDTEHRNIFGCPIEFDSDVNCLQFEASTFELPVKNPDERLLKILESYAEDILSKLHIPERDPVVQEAREIIAHYLPTNRNPTIERVSKDMNMSVRTLSRRLSQRGFTFRELVDSLRQNLAERYLRDETISLAQVAYLIGYSDQATLNRSFQRWTGQTPAQFRRDAF